MRSTNDQAPWFPPRQPVYPPLRQLVRVVGPVGVGGVQSCRVQQAVGNTFRDREQAFAIEANGFPLAPGIYKARLATAFQGLPLYAISTACCRPVASSSLSSSSVSAASLASSAFSVPSVGPSSLASLLSPVSPASAVSSRVSVVSVSPTPSASPSAAPSASQAASSLLSSSSGSLPSPGPFGTECCMNGIPFFITAQVASTVPNCPTGNLVSIPLVGFCTGDNNLWCGSATFGSQLFALNMRCVPGGDLTFIGLWGSTSIDNGAGAPAETTNFSCTPFFCTVNMTVNGNGAPCPNGTVLIFTVFPTP